MKIHERIKKRRIDLKLTADKVADAIGVSRSTYYRYESEDIEKMPTTVLVPLAKVLQTTPNYLMGWEEENYEFTNAQDAMKFLLEQPTLAAFGGYDASKMSDDQLIKFANRILKFIKMEAEDLEEFNIDNMD